MDSLIRIKNKVHKKVLHNKLLWAFTFSTVIHFFLILTIFVKFHKIPQNLHKKKILVEVIQINSQKKKKDSLTTYNKTSALYKITNEVNSELQGEYSHLESSALSQLNNSMQNAIRYPAMALERGWEDSVHILVYLLPNGKCEKLEYIQKSKYPVFNKTVENAVWNWKYPRLQKKVVVPLGFHFTIKSERW